MKTILRTTLIMLTLITVQQVMHAQIPLVIQGNVYNLNNQPIVGKQVTIVVDSVFGPMLPFSYTSVQVTGPNGFYVDTVLLPANTFFAMVVAYVHDCNNVAQYNVQTFSPPTPLPPMNFTICDSAVPPPSCNALFSAQTTPNSLMVSFTDLSVPSTGGTVNSWFWSFGDSATSTLQHPVHTYAASGLYNVCLTITDNLACSTTSCQLVMVQTMPPANCTAGFNALPVGGTTGVTFVNTSLSTYAPALHNLTFTWSFGDGTSATSSNMANVPHVYSAPGLYLACLSMQVVEASTLTVVCTDTWCDSVLVGFVNPTGYLYGMLTSNAAGAGTSVVYLIDHNTFLGTLTGVHTTYSIDSSGVTAYYFPNLLPGNYLVKAAMLPANPNYATNMPTYHQSSLFWSQATTVNVLPNATTQASIAYIQGINPSGPGFIGGLISQGANKGPGDPIEGVQVLLLDANNGDQPVAVTFSDVAGIFGFNNIPFGTYKVYAEMINKTTWPVIVTIDANTPSTDGLKIVVGQSVISSIHPSPGSPIGQIGQIHPNPANDRCYLEVEAAMAGTLSLEIHDLTGKAISSRQVQVAPGANTINIDVASLGQGIYFLSLTDASGSQTVRKLVRN